ncbi:MAG TPA: tetratricopeptide repeat protein [Actinomycetota bacterium]|nr:tetratricopeptide repeat protein [Actinomycetota bacterium]
MRREAFPTYSTEPPGQSAYDLYARGSRFLDEGHPHQAAMLLSRARIIEPDKGSIREALGRALYMSGRTAWARREFAKAVAIDPVNDYAHFGLALACERTGQRTRAIAHLKLAIAMRPGVTHYERALARLAG